MTSTLPESKGKKIIKELNRIFGHTEFLFVLWWLGILLTLLPYRKMISFSTWGILVLFSSFALMFFLILWERKRLSK